MSADDDLRIIGDLVLWRDVPVATLSVAWPSLRAAFEHELIDRWPPEENDDD